jgi:hypothetical protein
MVSSPFVLFDEEVAGEGYNALVVGISSYQKRYEL